MLVPGTEKPFAVEYVARTNVSQFVARFGGELERPRVRACGGGFFYYFIYFIF